MRISVTAPAATGFDLAEFARKLAFNAPVVEKTAPCDCCYRETPVDDMVSDLCPECVEKRIAQTDTAPCHCCGEWLDFDQFTDDSEYCRSCERDHYNDIFHHREGDY